MCLGVSARAVSAASRADLTCAGVQPGLVLSSRAAAPATWGADMLVPQMVL